MDLVGRNSELGELTDAWDAVVAGASRLAVVWGRRRVGKTFLLANFSQRRACVFFTATRNSSEADQMVRLTEATHAGLGDRANLAGGGFSNLEAALRFFQQVSIGSPLIVVLDEVTRLSAARADIGDVLSAVWESPPPGCQLLLIICSSAVGAMRELIGPDGGLYRRAQVELRVDPLDIWAAASLVGRDVAPIALIEAYAACGGYPLHLSAWDASKTTDDNLLALAGSPAGLLVRDAVDIMFEDLDARSGYERVLATMGRGPVRRSKIASQAQQRIDYTLGQLRRSGYVEAERPLGSAPTADPLFRLSDTYLRFWFAVLRDDADLIDGGQGAAVLKRVASRWNTHVQAVFEELARAHAQRLVARGELSPDTVIGRWWKDEAVEIDVLGLDAANAATLVGEAKWQSAPIDHRQVAALRRSAAALPFDTDDATIGIWTRASAHPDVAAMPDVRICTPADMFG